MRNDSHHRLTSVICLLTLLLTLGACKPEVVYHHYQHVTDNNWDKGDTIYFNIPPVKTSGLFHEEAELRISKEYPFLSISLLVQQTIFPQKKHQSDVINCDLISENGVMKGDGITLFNYQFPVRDIYLNSGDSVCVAIIHNMKRETMAGIADVGFCLTQLTTSRGNQVPSSVNSQENKQE